MSASREQAIANLGEYAIEADPSRRWRLIEAIYRHPTVTAALTEIGAEWGDVAHWRKSPDWLTEYTRALDTLADRQADRGDEAIVNGLNAIAEADPKKASAVATMYREQAQHARWRASVQAPKRWSEKAQEQSAQAVNVVVLLPPLTGTPASTGSTLTGQPTATARIAQAEDAQVVATQDVSVDDCT